VHRVARVLTISVLGLFEAGMYAVFVIPYGHADWVRYPGCTYTLTTWYTPAQIHSRTTIYYLGGVLSGAFSGKRLLYEYDVVQCLSTQVY
jgi:hypothetical protein